MCPRVAILTVLAKVPILGHRISNPPSDNKVSILTVGAKTL